MVPYAMRFMLLTCKSLQRVNIDQLQSLLMNSNQSEQTRTLYLKSFFGQYFQRKQHIQIISSIETSVSVIQQLIEQFQIKIGTKSIDIPPLFSRPIKQPHQEITQILQQIYNRLTSIFEHWRTPINTSIQNSTLKEKHANCDEELYQMLNDYKKQVKQQKQLRKKIQQQCAQLSKSLNIAQSDKTRLRCQKKQIKNQLSLVENRLQQKIEESKQIDVNFRNLLSQKQQLESRINQLRELGVQLAQKQMTIQQLNLSLEQSQKRQNQSKEKLKNVDQIIKARILESQDKWRQIIQAKINSEAVYSKPACKLLRDFVGKMRVSVGKDTN